MPDSIHARYAGMSHAELYQQLTAGNPGEVQKIVDAWKSAEEQADTLAASLDRDLRGLVAGWQSTGGTEFHSRVGLVGTFSRGLAHDFSQTRRGLAAMGTALAEAQAKAEHPDETDDHDKTLSGMATGAAVGSRFGPVGTVGGVVVGGIFGHNQDEEEKRKAQERMAALVASVATAYEDASYREWVAVGNPPPGLPEDAIRSQSGLGQAAQVGAPAAGPGPGGVFADRTTTMDPTVQATTGPGAGDGSIAPGDAGDGSSLAGVSGFGLTGLGGAGAGGGGVAAAAAGGAAGAAGSGLTAGGAAGGLIGGAAASAAAVGATNQAKSGAGLSRAAGSTGGRSGGSGARAANGMGSGRRSGRTGAASAAGPGGQRGASAATGRPATSAAASGARPAAARPGGARPADGEPDEHTTWLTEDNLIWRGDDGEVPPPVLGAQ